MKLNTEDFQLSRAGLPSPEKAFQWPWQAMNGQDWSEAAQRWAVVRQAYPERPGTWFQGAIAHIEANELDKADALLTYARKYFKNNPSSFTESARLAMRRSQWNLADSFLKQARARFPDCVQTWLESTEYALQKESLEQALAYNQLARQCAPNDPAPFIQYAELAMRTEQWKEASIRWDELRTRFPKIPAGYLRAAEAARHLDRQPDTRRLDIAPPFEENILKNNNNNPQIPRPFKQTAKKATIAWLMELIWTKALFNLSSEVHRNYLSYGWWILEPLLHMMVYYVVFGLLLQRAGENYPVFLLTGLIPWMWFMKAVSGSSGSILSGQNLIFQVGLPSMVFPLVSLLQTTLKQLPVFVLLVGFVWVQGHSPGVYWWALIPVIVVQALLTMATACAVAAMIPFVRDLSYLVPTGLTFLMFLSGTFYDYQRIPAEWQELFLLNPMAFLLKCYREIFIAGILPDLSMLLWWGLGSAFACLLLLLMYKRLRYIYPRILLE